MIYDHKAADDFVFGVFEYHHQLAGTGGEDEGPAEFITCWKHPDEPRWCWVHHDADGDFWVGMTIAEVREYNEDSGKRLATDKCPRI